MSRLSKGEHEFVSGFGELGPQPAGPAEAPAAPAAQSPGMEVIDARGINSPLPVLRAHRALRAMRPGETLKVITNSRATIAEFQALSKYVVGYELVSQEEAGDEVSHVLRKKR